MSVETESAWLARWEAQVRRRGWRIRSRNYRPDPGTCEAYGFYFYKLTRGGQEKMVRLGTVMMEEFSPVESVWYAEMR